MSSASFGANPGANVSSGPSTVSEIPKIEKTDFKATLQKIDPASKAKIIREIKMILPQLNLVEVNFI